MEHRSAVAAVTQRFDVGVLYPRPCHLCVFLDYTRCGTVRLNKCAEDDGVYTAGLEALESVYKRVRVTIIIAYCVQYFCPPCVVPSHTTVFFICCPSVHFLFVDQIKISGFICPECLNVKYCLTFQAGGAGVLKREVVDYNVRYDCVL